MDWLAHHLQDEVACYAVYQVCCLGWFMQSAAATLLTQSHPAGPPPVHVMTRSAALQAAWKALPPMLRATSDLTALHHL